MCCFQYGSRQLTKKVSICKGKKCGTTKVLPSLHQWLSGPCHFFFFFFSPIIALNGFWQFFLFFPNFGLKQPLEKGCLGDLPSEHFFMCVFPNSVLFSIAVIKLVVWRICSYPNLHSCPVSYSRDISSKLESWKWQKRD